MKQFHKTDREITLLRLLRNAKGLLHTLDSLPLNNHGVRLNDFQKGSGEPGD